MAATIADGLFALLCKSNDVIEFFDQRGNRFFGPCCCLSFQFRHLLATLVFLSNLQPFTSAALPVTLYALE